MQQVANSIFCVGKSYNTSSYLWASVHQLPLSHNVGWEQWALPVSQRPFHRMITEHQFQEIKLMLTTDFFIRSKIQHKSSKTSASKANFLPKFNDQLPPTRISTGTCWHARSRTSHWQENNMQRADSATIFCQDDTWKPDHEMNSRHNGHNASDKLSSFAVGHSRINPNHRWH